MGDSDLDSEFGSEFLAGLDEIGIGGIGPPTKKTEKKIEKKTEIQNQQNSKPKEQPKKPQNTAKKTETINMNPPKKRGPRAPRINLMDLSSLFPPTTPISPLPRSPQGIDSRNNSNPFQSQQINNVYQQNPNNSRTSNQIAQIENRLTTYLQNSLKQVANEFISLLPSLFKEEDIVTPATNALLSQLQDDIKRIVIFQMDQTPQSAYNPVSQVFESYAPLFKDLYYDAERAKGKNYSEKTKLIKEARSTALSSSTIFKTQVTETMDEFTSLVNELNFSRMTEKNRQQNYDKRRNAVRSQLYSLEAKKIELRGKEKAFKRQKRTFETEQDNFTNNNDVDLVEFQTILRSSLESIRNDIFSNDDSDSIRNFQKNSYQIDSLLEEIDAMRNMKMFQMQNFSDATAFAQTITFTYNTMRPSLPNESFNQDESNESDLSFESSGLTPSPSKELKRKFHSITRKRKDQLQNATDFMDSVRRVEKKRNRKKVTDISLLSSA